MPTPAILANNIHLFVMNKTEISPMPPQTARSCEQSCDSFFRQRRQQKAIRKQTTL